MAWVTATGPKTWRVRYQRDDGTVGSVCGFRTEQAAIDYKNDLESDRRCGRWLDPSGSKTTLAEWVRRWWHSLDLDLRTLENYDSYLRQHILPRFGHVPMGNITTLDINLWIKESGEPSQTRPQGYAPSTIRAWVNVLSMILTDAVDQRLIATNPVQKRRRRGRRSRHLRPERPWATPEEVVRIADQAALLSGPVARLLIITAAWTGCRWGELAGLHRRNVRLDQGVIVIDPMRGSLHEARGKRWIGPPKTPSSARTITLPPFLVAMLRDHLASHPYEYVFTTACGAWFWRSTFNRRILRPAIDGNHDDNVKARLRTEPVKPALTFHGLRHSHKTWLIDDGVPEIGQSKRLGHHLQDRVVETYRHVAPGVEKRLLTGLEHRWCGALSDPTNTSAPGRRTSPSR
jgi:integrase